VQGPFGECNNIVIILNDIQTEHSATLVHIKSKMCLLLCYVKEKELFKICLLKQYLVIMNVFLTCECA
jgi:hypothetical protein